MSHSGNKPNPVAPRSRFYHGSYGRLFPSLAPWAPKLDSSVSLENHFKGFAKDKIIKDPESDSDSNIPAGYTYFGQFIDHDLTFDPTPLGELDVDPERLHNFRTPRLDLDCIYGDGPGVQPYMYERDKKHFVGDGFTGKFLIGKVSDSDFDDLPRNSEDLALIGDMRNDENAIVAQIHLAFLLAHNALVDQAAKAIYGDDAETKEDKDGNSLFGMARQSLCRLYQWIVWNDFLKRVTLEEIHKTALRSESSSQGDKGKIWRLGLEDIYNWKDQPFMPVEFSAAAYRFGHSMVRDSYQTNSSTDAGLNEHVELFDGSNEDEETPRDLRGFRALGKRQVVQWNWFLEMRSDPNLGFPQQARKIDTKLSDSLKDLPNDDGNLAVRNLVRGVRLKLPSGPDAAQALGLSPISLEQGEPESLWFYVLKEAQEKQDGEKLGELGSLILCSVFAGILKGCPASCVNVAPGWTPDEDSLLKPLKEAVKGDTDQEWTLASVIRLSGLPVSGGDINVKTTRENGE